MPNLTVREWGIITLVVEGLRNREIGKRVGMTEHVVKNRLRVIFDKVGCWNRVELALWSTARELDAKQQRENNL